MRLAVEVERDVEELLLAQLALQILLDRQVVPAFGPRQTDRHGRLVAQLWRAAADGSKEVWVQEALLADGFARVATTPDNLLLAAEMLRAEDRARRARRGLWGDPAYRVRTPEDAGEALDAFQLVEGRVLAVAVRLPVFAAYGLYRMSWSQVSVGDLVRVALATAFGSALLGTLFLAARGRGFAAMFPTSVVLLDFFITLTLVGGFRSIRRVLKSRAPSTRDGVRVLIAGAGSAGELILRAMQDEHPPTYLPVGFVDDDPHKGDVTVRGGTEAAVGAAVCRSGRTSGWRCGRSR